MCELPEEALSHLVGVVVADDALVLGEAQLAALVGGQSEGGQEAWTQGVDRGVVVGNCSQQIHTQILFMSLKRSNLKMSLIYLIIFWYLFL